MRINRADRLITERQVTHLLSALILTSLIMEIIMKKNVTYKRLHDVLDYNKRTGLFHWKIPRKCVKSGSVAGSKSKDSKYIGIRVDDKLYKAHRLAWFYEKGYFPEHGLDHKDRVRHHNWIDNLREATQQCNLRNIGNPKSNTSGVKGVTFDKVNNKWTAQISINRKHKNMGRFIKFSDAVEARWGAEKKYNFPNCCTTSPAYEYLKNNNLIDKEVEHA